MSYVNAKEVLPDNLIQEIQKYVDGKVLYIPCKAEKSLSWGEKNGTRDRLAKRNREIVSKYCSGKSVADLGKIYYLSEKRIQGIIHEYESSHKHNGGFINE